jgi:hypothetical protein
MLPKVNLISRIKTGALAATLLLYPCGLIAQHGGGGGGHIGGGSAGGGGLSGGGRATGLDTKDDLKDFHEALAVQATKDQVIEYNLTMKSTESAGAELQALLDRGKGIDSAQLVSRSKILEQATEKARTENTKFLESFSDRQKSGLKETIKKLNKADSELAQSNKLLEVEVIDAKPGWDRVMGPAQSLERALTSFRNEQIGLGEEMSIGAHDGGQEVSFNIPPVTNSLSFAGQRIAITTSGFISKDALQSEQNTLKLELTSDISDLQLNIAEVLQAQLNKADDCGEQIAIRGATLTPSTPASVVVAQVHYERWACFGRGNSNEIVEGNGTIEVKLTPAVGEDGGLGLIGAIGRVDAQGLVGDLLRSGTLGEFVRDKIAETMLLAVRQSADYKTTIPSAAQGNVTLRRAQFQATGLSKLSVVLEGDIRLSGDKVAGLTTNVKNSQTKGPTSSPETTPR